MKKIIIFITLIVLVLGGCKKVDLQEPISNDPVFTIEAVSNNDTLNWVGGDNDFYMFSEFSKDNFEVYTLTGRMAKDGDCITDCDSSLTFSIRSSYATPSEFNIDEAIDIGSFSYFTNDSTAQDTGFQYSFSGGFADNSFGSQPISFLWTIIGDTIETLQGSNITSEQFGTSDIDVSLEIGTPGNCTPSIRKILQPGVQDNCGLIFTNMVDSFSGNIAGIAVEYDTSAGGNPVNWPIDWLNGNGGSTLNFANIPQGGPFSLTAGNPAGGDCSVELDACVIINPQGTVSEISIPKFEYTITPILGPPNPNEQFSTAIIEYQVDSKVYSSIYGNNDNYDFKIINIEEYDDNELGQKTKKLTVEYSAQLCTESGDCRFFYGDGVIAVAYPE